MLAGEPCRNYSILSRILPLSLFTYFPWRDASRCTLQILFHSKLISPSEPLYEIPVEGCQWETPKGFARGGGDWLVGRVIRVYWDLEEKWYAGIVGSFDGRKDAEDSHGNKGAVHDVFYEDGSYLENLHNARWQFDLNEGQALQPKCKNPMFQRDLEHVHTLADSLQRKALADSLQRKALADSCRKRRTFSPHTVMIRCDLGGIRNSRLPFD